jgi:hypothetical protein
MLPRLGKIPTPLEVVDAGLDSVAEVAKLPARLMANLGQSGAQAAQGIQSAIDQPKNVAEIPASPDVVIKGGLSTLTSVGSGVVDAIQKGVQSVQETGEGVKAQFDQLLR